MPGTERLKKSRAFFLAHHKCSASDVDGFPFRDADGIAWPQTSFSGRCAVSPSDFEIADLIANGKLYRFEVTIDPAALPECGLSETSNPLPADAARLHEALIELVAATRFADATPAENRSDD